MFRPVPLAVLVVATVAAVASLRAVASQGRSGGRPAAIQEWTVTSPDERTSLVVARHANGQLTWRAMRGINLVIAPSPLGVRRADQSFVDGLRLVNARGAVDVKDDYQTVHGKRRAHHVSARERVLTFANATGARVVLTLRAHNDGVAFRYAFPELDATAKTVVEELTGFAVPAGSTAWMQAQQPVGMYAPAYEDLYTQVRSGTAAPAADGWALPALFHTAPGPWALISESGMDGGYSGSHLAQTAPDGVYRLRFPDPQEGRGVGDALPRSPLPWALPWRLVVIADAATGILESDLVNDLSPPTRITDTSWITPGRAAWSWWSDSDSPKHAERLNAFTDFAAEMGWEYSLVDANWNLMQSGSIDDVRAHAREKHIGLMLWYNSGGPHNAVTEAPRDRMLDRGVRRAEMAKLQEWGIKGIKVDFWQSDKQDRMQQYRALLQDAADFHLLVNFHGATIPRGWEREFPHLVGMEAVLGAEQYKFRTDFPQNAASHNTVLPFTRNVIGAMDYTPVTFTDSTYPRVTTNAHELALSVVFETAVQHFADSAEAYRALSNTAKSFLRQVPAAWEETYAISGEPGKSVVVARQQRGAAVWFVGGIAANAAETVNIPLRFLQTGVWQMTLIADGASDRTFATTMSDVRAENLLDVPMRARGGFVMRLVRR